MDAEESEPYRRGDETARARRHQVDDTENSTPALMLSRNQSLENIRRTGPHANGASQQEDRRGQSEDDDTPEQEPGSSGHAVSPPPSLERVPSRRAEWATLESAESRVSAAPPVTGAAPPGRPLSAIATELYTVSYLIFFSIFGALARIGLGTLTFYRGAPVATGVLWANVGGCIVMGFLAEDRNLFREEWGVEIAGKELRSNAVPGHHPNYRHCHPHPHQNLPPEESLKVHKSVKKTIPLYIGLTTGFCGSFTSFSTFMKDAFLALSNALPNPDTNTVKPRNGGYSFMAVVAVIIYTVGLSLASLVFGSHLAIALDRFTPTIPFIFMRKLVDRVMVLLGVGCWLGAIFLAIWPADGDQGIHQTWRGRAVFAIIFAPLGCVFRFYVSLLLNARVPTFPLGTFLVNIFGSMIEAMCYDLKYAAHVAALAPGIPTSLARLTGCQVLNGVMDGFCGCTTTVSTWVAELFSLELRHAYFYGVVTIAVGLAFTIVIMGSLGWTEGFGVPFC